jgi:hypothetical protein
MVGMLGSIVIIGNFEDPWRRHLEIIPIVRQDARQVVSVPRGDPFLGKGLGKLAADHRLGCLTPMRQ